MPKGDGSSPFLSFSEVTTITMHQIVYQIINRIGESSCSKNGIKMLVYFSTFLKKRHSKIQLVTFVLFCEDIPAIFFSCSQYFKRQEDCLVPFFVILS